MKACFFIFILFTFFSETLFSQNIILPETEYMDTTSNRDTACKDYDIYFYQAGGKYPRSSSTVLQEVKNFLLKTNNSYINSGYITFRFLVGCDGFPMPKTEVLQTDEAYTKFHFDKGLVTELFSFFKTMGKWNIAKTKAGEPLAFKSFITFKIKDGKVVNIIP